MEEMRSLLEQRLEDLTSRAEKLVSGRGAPPRGGDAGQ